MAVAGRAGLVDVVLEGWVGAITESAPVPVLARVLVAVGPCVAVPEAVP